MKPGTVVSYILKAIIVTFFISAIWRNNWIIAFGCFAGIMFTILLPIVLKLKFNITLPWILDLMITVAFFIHICGDVLYVYDTILNYDDIAHFVSACVVALVVLIAVYILNEYWGGLQADKYGTAFVVIITTVAMGVVWEFREWSADALFGMQTQLSLEDTMTDLLVNALGGVFIAIVGIRLLKNGALKEMTKDLGERVGTHIINKKKP
ncbi:hypothetical protein C5S36_12960 [Candidatus Methanophagaceae archaeon]|nr:hypothetical protein C5S36_12960 [Methanophagales archaeon]